MTAFSHRTDGWLVKAVFDQLSEEHANAWRWLAEGESTRRAPHEFARVQNNAMLLKFFLEQAFGSGRAAGRALQLIERDFGSIETFRSRFLDLAVDPSIEWIIWGLSFADFRFHLFPVSRALGAMPFCVSPMLAACVRQVIVETSGLDRTTFVTRQLAAIDWTIIEKRLACLEEPLDLFGNNQDCAETDSKCSAVAK